ncbi:hypothetical protein BV898_19460 [Hypsibius exemplaris]|uniref:EB domain-containing protein n=1 Tax=Hypsibius exemplaris TaxID=2072580 RepID=A0A9X6NJ99_HYPEX|nr:hypothetical protein BV898_19460 [Hypsibius exemplaris]
MRIAGLSSLLVLFVVGSARLREVDVRNARWDCRCTNGATTGRAGRADGRKMHLARPMVRRRCGHGNRNQHRKIVAIPKSSTPFVDAECESNEDCVNLVNTECRISTVAAPSFTRQKVLPVQGRFRAGHCSSNSYCMQSCDAPAPSLTLFCITTGALTGKCGCPEGKSAVTVPTTGLTCLDVTQIPCNVVTGNPAGSCPFIGGRVGGANTAVCAFGKCGCQVKLNQVARSSHPERQLSPAPQIQSEALFTSQVTAPTSLLPALKTGTITPTKAGNLLLWAVQEPQKNDSQ